MRNGLGIHGRRRRLARTAGGVPIGGAQDSNGRFMAGSRPRDDAVDAAVYQNVWDKKLPKAQTLREAQMLLLKDGKPPRAASTFPMKRPTHQNGSCRNIGPPSCSVATGDDGRKAARRYSRPDGRNGIKVCRAPSEESVDRSNGSKRSGQRTALKRVEIRSFSRTQGRSRRIRAALGTYASAFWWNRRIRTRRTHPRASASSLKGKEVCDLSVIVHGDVQISARRLQATFAIDPIVCEGLEGLGPVRSVSGSVTHRCSKRERHASVVSGMPGNRQRQDQLPRLTERSKRQKHRRRR
jgi:hypothetical protein